MIAFPKCDAGRVHETEVSELNLCSSARSSAHLLLVARTSHEMAFDLRRTLPTTLTHVDYVEFAEIVENVSELLEAAACMLSNTREHANDRRLRLLMISMRVDEVPPRVRLLAAMHDVNLS